MLDTFLHDALCMATTHPMPTAAAVPNGAARKSGPARAAAPVDVARNGASSSAAEGSSQALVPVAHVAGEGDGDEFSAPVMRLPVELDVAVPVRAFRVRNLLALAPGQLVETQWVHGNDLPLAAGEVQLAWSEFEVVETRLGVRITHLA